MKSKKILALMTTLLMGATTIGAFSGCGGGGTDSSTIENSNFDPLKANIAVATYDGGVGKAWLEDAARRFEKLHENSTHFEEGKVGVAVDVDADKVIYGGTYLADRNLTKDVYFVEGVEYSTYVTRDKVADLTDVVKASMSDFGESGTIEDKLDPAFRDYLTANDTNSYYMLPFYDGVYGFVYDIDLFEEESLYFDADGDFIGLEKGASDDARAEFEEAKSNGPDGQANTYDDGLPTTYAQLIQLADAITNKGMIPFCYSGNYSDYVDKVCRSFAVDYEGYDAMRLNYTFNGTATLVKSTSGDNITTEEVTITPENAYELQRQAGKYYMLDMEEKLFGSTKYIGGSYNAMSFTEAQRIFLYSKWAEKRYAMLMEGAWWENEASAIFDEIENARGEKKTDRRFGFLPIPKVDENHLGTQTMISFNSSFGFVNKESQNLKLAKEFMRFLHSDAEMSKFSAKTSITRALNYTVLEEDRGAATHFGQSLIDMRSTAKVIYPYSSEKLIVDNLSSFTETKWYATANIGGDELEAPFIAFKEGTATAKTYFDGLYNAQKLQWPMLNR